MAGKAGYWLEGIGKEAIEIINRQNSDTIKPTSFENIPGFLTSEILL
jgi:hypothetical protein